MFYSGTKTKTFQMGQYTTFSIHFIFSTACRGVDDTGDGRNVLPRAVSNFRGCVIVNGDLIFNFNTYREFRYGDTF